jgi:hypothetical protein
MRCQFIPGTNAIMCGPEVVDESVVVDGKKVWFDFDERFGPLVLRRKGGKPLANQPGDRHPFWTAFQAWLDKRRGLAPLCTYCGGSGSVVSQQLGPRSFIAKRCPRCNGSGRSSRGDAGTEGT